MENPKAYLENALLLEHSKAQTMRIVHYIGSDAEHFASLMDIFLHSEYRLVQRSAWVVGYMSETNPKLIEPYLEKMLHYLNQPAHDAVKRNTMRVLRDLKEIPESVQGMVADICFRYLETPSVALAIRSFSIRVLFKICQKEPELRAEFKLLLENILENDHAPAIQVAGKEIYKKL